MTKIKITDDIFIFNDMPRGWKSKEKWRDSLYHRWRTMWLRCYNPKSRGYDTYKDCSIDDRYKYLSNYISDIMTLENFNKLQEEPSKWHIDKDIIDPNNKIYSYEYLSIISASDNSVEALSRNGNPKPKRPIIGINIDTNTIIILKCMTDGKSLGLNSGGISNCCDRNNRSYKGYKWYSLYMSDRRE